MENYFDKQELLRKTFIEAEREYTISLIHNSPVIRNLIISYNGNFTNQTLFQKAQALINDVENGLVPDTKMGDVEKQLIVLFAAIYDKEIFKELIFAEEEAFNKDSHHL